ncbi:glutamate racemase [Dechloromonas sp. ZS-1]|uniref:glutamate racemase n=1 Tax=Dechloromonas sp. ZS-1 TaxID=3138067 RepID=UPI0031FC1A8F
MNAKPIAVFDSGLGGLTVLQALRARLPHEDFLYFADTRFLPYGEKPEAFLRERGVRIAERLAERGCKALVVACNTATAAAAESIRAAIDLPIVALEPGVKPAIALTQSRVIGVLATTRTLQSERFRRLVDAHGQGIQVIAQPCPGLADAIEEAGTESATVAALLDAYVTPLRVAGADVVVLGCTHYPWVAEAIAARMPPGTCLLDTGEAVARQLERLLAGAGLQGQGGGQVRIATSGAPQQVAATVDRLLGQKMQVEHWEP